MIEQAVGPLQLVQVGGHFERGAVQVDLVAGGAVGLELEDGDHIRVVDPETGFAGQAIGRGVLPLLVGQLLAEREVLRILGADVQLQRHDAEDGVVDVALPGDDLLLSLFGPPRVVALDQRVGHRLIVGQLGELERGVPGGILGVMNIGPGRNPARWHEHVLDNFLADFLGRGAGRPVGEFLLLCYGGAGEPNDHESGEQTVNDGAHTQSSPVRFGSLRLTGPQTPRQLPGVGDPKTDRPRKREAAQTTNR